MEQELIAQNEDFTLNHLGTKTYNIYTTNPMLT